jgi:hypothetical protein
MSSCRYEDGISTNVCSFAGDWSDWIEQARAVDGFYTFYIPLSLPGSTREGPLSPSNCRQTAARPSSWTVVSRIRPFVGQFGGHALNSHYTHLAPGPITWRWQSWFWFI